jgi:uncharacterized protein (TIGR02001 family)
MITMKRTLVAGISVLFLMLGSLAPTAKAEDRLSVSATVDYASKYIWRGYNITDAASLQPGVSASVDALGGSFSAAWWASMNLSGDEENEFIEHDWVASYGFDALGGSFETGIIYYYFPQVGSDGVDDTIDAYVTYSAGLGKTPLTFDFGAYYEFDESDGLYLNAGLSAEFEITKKWTLGLGANIGWADENYNEFTWGTDEGALNDFNISVSISAPIDEKSSLSIGVNYTELLDSDIEDAVEDAGGQSDSVWFVAGIEIAI